MLYDRTFQTAPLGPDPFIVARRLRLVLYAINRLATTQQRSDDEQPEHNNQLKFLASIIRPIRQLATQIGTVVTCKIEINGNTARSYVIGPTGSCHILTVLVNDQPPYRVINLHIAEFDPPGLAPRLPLSFTNYRFPVQAGEASMLAVFAGVPGSGKSTLAEAAGKELHIPVFNADWLLGALTPFGGYQIENRQIVGAELLTTLAIRQLNLGQSAIVDFPAEDLWIRNRWRTLAQSAGAHFKAVICICPDADIHRRRLMERRRAIPGWHDGGNWPSIARRRQTFPSWDGDFIVVNTMKPHEVNVAAVLKYLRGESPCH